MPISFDSAKARFDGLIATWAPVTVAIGELGKFFSHPAVKPRWEKAPASSRRRYHHAYDGGLLIHTVEVIDVMTRLADAMVTSKPNPGLYQFGPKVSYTYSQMLLCAALHDISKIGDVRGNEYYVPNILKKGDRSEAEPYKTSDGMFKYGSEAVSTSQREAAHLAEVAVEYVPEGEISLAIVRAIHTPLYILLDEEVKFAIRYHDGAYGPGRRFMNGKETPLQMLLHAADMWSSRMNHEEFRG